MYLQYYILLAVFVCVVCVHDLLTIWYSMLCLTSHSTFSPSSKCRNLMLSIQCFVPQRSHYRSLAIEYGRGPVMFLQCGWSGEITSKRFHLFPIRLVVILHPSSLYPVALHHPIHKSEFQQLSIVTTGIESLNEDADCVVQI